MTAAERVERAAPQLMYTPSVLVVLVVVGIPTLELIRDSFYVREILYGRIYFAGLEHYLGLLSDPLFLRYLGNTLIYVFFSVTFGLLIGLVLALAINTIRALNALFLTLLLIPWMIPDVAAGIMWRWIFDQIFGVLNAVLLAGGLITRPVYWLGKMPNAMIAVIIIEVWTKVPVIMLLIYAGLQRIPRELEEAMTIDGAGRWSRFWKLTVPFIMPEILFALSITTMFTLRSFGIVYIVTGGGPGDKTEVVATYIYKVGQLFMRQGLAAAMSVVLLLITVVLLLIYLRAIRIRIHE